LGVDVERRIHFSPDGGQMPLALLSDLVNSRDLPICRRQVAQPEVAIDPLPLIPGTEQFCPENIIKWHKGGMKWQPLDVACYFISDATVSGDGLVWVQDRLITSQEVMPKYVFNRLDIPNGGNARLLQPRNLPVRTITKQCMVAVGHGIKVYGHFLIEMLFRLAVTKRAVPRSVTEYSLLLDLSAPDWLLKILRENFHFELSDIEFFDSQKEQVLLHQAIVPGRVFLEDRVHPVANTFIDEYLHQITMPKTDKKRIFVTRRKFVNPAAPQRICVNEAELVSIAGDYGFTPVVTEQLTWPEQITLFRDAEIILGQAGSALHNALFSSAGSRLASIGYMNDVQQKIGALRAQYTAYFVEDIKLSGNFFVDEQEFSKFVGAICA
jgi:capsular polysaccharide biosynthesis protein